jgi:mono/diheme cytochrome c family protein
MRPTLSTLLALTILAGSAAAQPQRYVLPEETAKLKPDSGPGYAAAEANCLACHSADYIAYQPPGKGAAFWEAEVAKMIKVYHATIDAADAKAIAAYLAKTY